MKYAIAVALIFPILASANDSVGGISAGGIVLRSTDAIAMKKEVLNISHRRISVDYEFLNESAKDVEETIIFPLPVYSAYGMEGDSYQGQPPSFSIVVDGKPVQFQTIVQAFLDGIDVTTQLRKAGLSDAQIAFPPFKKAGIPPLSDQQRLRLGKLKLFGETIIGDIGPLWKIQVNYVWQQKFPANKVVKVHHAYRPFISTGPGQWRMDEETARRYCADPQFLASWKKLAKRESSDGSMLIAAKVGYVVKTGNNWKNGIEDFTLNLIKEKPSELVSVCFPGTFKKIDAKTYQVRLRNFRPSQDLDVYFGNVDIAGDAYKGELPVLRK